MEHSGALDEKLKQDLLAQEIEMKKDEYFDLRSAIRKRESEEIGPTQRGIVGKEATLSDLEDNGIALSHLLDKTARLRNVNRRGEQLCNKLEEQLKMHRKKEELESRW